MELEKGGDSRENSFLMGETLACLNADGKDPGEDADCMGEVTSDGQRFSGGHGGDSHGQMLGLDRRP